MSGKEKLNYKRGKRFESDDVEDDVDYHLENIEHAENTLISYFFNLLKEVKVWINSMINIWEDYDIQRSLSCLMIRNIEWIYSFVGRGILHEIQLL